MATTETKTRTTKLDTGEQIVEHYQRLYEARWLPADGEYEATWAVVEVGTEELWDTYDSQAEAVAAAEAANWHEEE